MPDKYFYNVSWITVLAVAASIAAWYGLRYLFKKRHAREYQALYADAVFINQQETMSGQYRNNSWLKPDNTKHHFSTILMKWLYTFEYLKLKDMPFSIYCAFTQTINVLSIYFIITQPLFIEWSGKW